MNKTGDDEEFEIGTFNKDANEPCCNDPNIYLCIKFGETDIRNLAQQNVLFNLICFFFADP